MATICERTKKILCMTGVTLFILLPIESSRILLIGTSIFPLLLFAGGEYIITGEQKTTETIASSIENGLKSQVETIAKDAGFTCRIY